MVFTALENVHPLQNFDFLYWKIVTITKPNIVRIISIYAKVLHSELIFFLSYFLYLVWNQLAISVWSFFCLHNKYTVKIVASTDIIAEMNMKMSTM